MNISRLIITPLSRESIARLVITPTASPVSEIDQVTVSRVAGPFSGIARLVVSALSVVSVGWVLSVGSASAQNVGDFLIDEKTTSTGRVTLRSWPKGANTLWGTDANGLPQKIIIGAGLSLGSGSLIATGGSGIAISSVTGLQTALDGKAAASEVLSSLSASAASAYGIELIEQADADLARTHLGLGASGTVVFNFLDIGGLTTSGDISATGNITGGQILGNGAFLTALNASELTSGTLPAARLPTTITGLSSVTSTTFVGALTGTASGNLALAGGTLTGAVNSNINSLATTTLPAVNLINSTPALVGAQVQVSPALIFEGQGWKTNATAASQSVRFRQSVLPITGTASPSGILLFQSDINGANTWTTRLGVGFGATVNGLYTETGGGIFFAGIGAGNQNNVGISGAGVSQLNLHANGGITHSLINNSGQGLMQAFNAGGFAWSSTGTASGAADVVLRREAPNHLAQRNGTTAQRFAVANTYTSTTNNEVAVLDWQTTTNTLRIGTDKGSGGGSNRPLQIIMGGVVKITLLTDGNILLHGLPTSAPATSNAVWRDDANGGVLKQVP